MFLVFSPCHDSSACTSDSRCFRTFLWRAWPWIRYQRFSTLSTWIAKDQSEKLETLKEYLQAGCQDSLRSRFVRKKHQNWDWTSCMRHPTRYLLLVGVCTQDSHLLSHFFWFFFLPNEISSWKEIGTEKTLVAAADGLITKPEVRGDFDKMAIDCITEEWRDFPWKSVVVFESKSQSSAKKMSKMWLS